jgi:Helix-turn-helix domain
VVAYDKRFAELVRRATGERSYRSLAPHVGVSPAYIADMHEGRVPSRDVVLALARATGANANELLLAAGYAPETPVWDPDKAFVEGIRTLAREFAQPVEFSTEDLPLAGARPEEIERALDAIRRRLGERQRT